MNGFLSRVPLRSPWPSTLDERLDKVVAYLFCQTKSKIMFNLANKSRNCLMLELIIPHVREKLLILVLQEFEALILDVAEEELSIADIYVLNSKILYDLVYKSGHKFVNNILRASNKLCLKIYPNDLYFRSILKDNKVISGNLIAYLLFGTSGVFGISFQYVEALLHNLIIKVSDLVLHIVLSRESIYKVIYQIRIPCLVFSQTYWSMRSIEELQNNMAYQHVKYFYVDQPKAIYSNRYQITILSPQGILSKTISVNRISELNDLSYVQLFLPSLLEIQDFLIPKLKYMVFIVGRIIIYISFSVVNNLLQFFLHTITRGFVKLTKS